MSIGESSLVEDVKKIVAVALAKQRRYTKSTLWPVNEIPPEPDSGEVTREILETVARSLEDRGGGQADDDYTAGWIESRAESCRWLRSQAQGEVEKTVGPQDCERVELGDGAAFVCRAQESPDDE